MTVIAGDTVTVNDLLYAENNVAIKITPPSTSTFYPTSVAEVNREGGARLGYFELAGASSFYDVLEFATAQLHSSAGVVLTKEGGVDNLHIFPTKDYVDLKITDFDHDAISYVSTDFVNELPLADTWIGGAMLYQFDIDFSQGSGAINFDIQWRRIAGNGSYVNLMGSVEVSNMASLEQALLEVLPANYIVPFVVGDKFYLKVVLDAVATITANRTPFLVNPKIVRDTGMMFDSTVSLIGDNDGRTDKFTFIPSTNSDDDVYLVISPNSDGTSKNYYTIDTLERSDLGTSAMESLVTDIPEVSSIISNTSQGTVYQLDSTYSIQLQYNSREDYLRRVGLFYVGDVLDALTTTIDKPENEVEAQSSESEVIYYTPKEGTIGFDLYDEVEGAGETLSVKTYLGTTQEIKDTLIADGYTLVETYAPNIGIEVPDGNELVIYNLVDVTATTDPTTFENYWKELHIFDLVSSEVTRDVSSIPVPDPVDPPDDGDSGLTVNNNLPYTVQYKRTAQSRAIRRY